MKNWMFALLIAMTLSGCTSATRPSPNLPYRSWSMGYATPWCMEAWVEDTVVEDTQGRRFRGATGLVPMSGPTKGWAPRRRWLSYQWSRLAYAHLRALAVAC
ncbi:DUF2931 family protein [Lysobacter sp. MMG2]|nr:DUF2931 family protein [Lysobacter sp. MMG2]